MFQKVMGIFFFLAFSTLNLNFGVNVCSAEITWEQINTGNNEVNIRSLSVFAKNPDYVCAASSKQLYFSPNSGLQWESIFSLQGRDEEINFVVFDAANPKIIYLATTAGLLITSEQGKQWTKALQKVNDADNNVQWIVQDERGGNLPAGKIYAGTQESLYQSEDSGAKWKKVNSGLPRSKVRTLALHPANSQVLYLANDLGLFKSIDNGSSWQRIYVTSYKSTGEGEENEDTLSEEGQDLISSIAVNKSNPKEIFIATANGVYRSADAGEVWEKLSAQGLTCGDINYIIISQQDILYAATKKGVFRFNTALNRWDSLYQGMTALNVCSLALNNRSNYLFAATDRGIYRTKIGGSQTKVRIDRTEEKDVEEILKKFALNEPTIQQVQEAALKYGEIIHPESIKGLRKSARLKGFFPTVSVDYDKTIEEGGTTTNFGKFAIGPKDWGVSLSWDVGDIIFNEQLRLIDSNTRLAVQLRDDILNEVTRLYYERQKLQTELALKPPKNQDDKLTKLLRVKELTANIDALTGGYFSNYLTRMK